MPPHPPLPKIAAQHTLKTRRNHAVSRCVVKAKGKAKRRERSALTRTMLDGSGQWTLVAFLAVVDFCALQTVSKAWRRSMMTENAWKSICQSLQASAMLYAPANYAAGWKALFWRHLWSARSKWKMLDDETRAESATDFKIVVHCRFRPATAAARQRSAAAAATKGICMPLHQRLRLMRAGKIKKSELLKHGVASDGLRDLRSLMEAQELPADVVDALMEAQELERAAKSCEQRRDAARATSTDGGAAERAERAVEIAEASAAARGDEAGVGGAAAAACGAVPSAASEIDAAASEAEGGARSHGGSVRRTRDVRVLAVQARAVMMYIEGAGLRPFHHATAYDGDASQAAVYAGAGRDAVVSALNGFNSCILCYGQTGSGKTHTIFGDAVSGAGSKIDPRSANAGVVLRAIDELITGSAALERTFGITTRLALQYVTLYQERLTDLISGAPCRLRDGGAHRGSEQFFLSGAESIAFANVDEAAKALSSGEQHKVYAATKMNARSSRAHTILIITIEQTNERTQTTARSCIHIADLAGSEQVKKSGVVGDRFREAVGINSSLLALKMVITALQQQQSHVPFYDSVLTKILKGALGGSSRTTVVVTCARDDANGEETLSSLRFGERCASITNRASISSMSLDDALGAIRGALETCRSQMDAMRAAGRSHLAAFSKLQQRFQQLVLKQNSLHRALRSADDSE